MAALFPKLVRYAVVGGVVMAVFTGLNWLFGLWVGKDVAFLMAYPPALALHFWLNKTWTFASNRKDSARQVSEYVVMAIITFLIQLAVFKLVTRYTQLPGWAAALISNAAQIVITFCAMQFRIFKNAPEL